MNKVFSTSVSMVFGMVLLTGCQHVTKEPVVVDKIASVEASQTQTLVNIKDVFDAGAENIPTLTRLVMPLHPPNRAVMMHKNV